MNEYYLPARLVIVQIHQRYRTLGIFPALPAVLRVHECSGEGNSEVYVVRTP